MHLDDARAVAVGLMARHGLHTWKFRFDHARRRFGSCRYAARTITLSRPLVLLNDESQVRDTILHEIAHALTPGDGHGARWKAACLQVGASPTRCYDVHAVRAPARPAAKYRLGCKACDWWVDRRKLSPHRYICKRCRGKLVYQERVALAG